ncbi:hypothetical protein SynBIOSE41_01797 [Synechococcus sp. BIOS-E4-1]|uniref:hypothetical protein n=1 Tax=Synechococcus sp. BIOS-E4-1 TaxID=1400864 RepID=UPI0016491CD1|nr:hypothetical protein [Synechococcus sp. BIOS-E4-1]QNI54308.1 hypothetical protein SynBIOSE41_01797 [Synechococcus sp. BIOS-E4-1]
MDNASNKLNAGQPETTNQPTFTLKAEPAEFKSAPLENWAPIQVNADPLKGAFLTLHGHEGQWTNDGAQWVKSLPEQDRPEETMARPESKVFRATEEQIAQQDLANANIEDRVAQKVSDKIDPRLSAANKLSAKQVTNEQNHYISNKSLLHGLGGDHEVLSEKVGLIQAAIHKIAVNQFLEMEAAQKEREEAAAFREETRRFWKLQDKRWEESQSFMDEFRVEEYRKDGSLDF